MNVSADNPKFLFMANRTRSSATQKKCSTWTFLYRFYMKIQMQTYALQIPFESEKTAVHIQCRRNQLTLTHIQTAHTSKRKRKPKPICLVFLFAPKRREQKKTASVRAHPHPPTAIFYDYPISCQSSTIRFHTLRTLTVLIFVSRFAAHRSRVGFSVRQWTLPIHVSKRKETKRRKHSQSHAQCSAAQHILEYSNMIFLFHFYFAYFIFRWFYCLSAGYVSQFHIALQM